MGYKCHNFVFRDGVRTVRPGPPIESHGSADRKLITDSCRFPHSVASHNGATSLFPSARARSRSIEKNLFPKLNEFLCYQNLCSSAVCVKKRAGERLNLVLLLRLYKREREREGRKRASQPWLEADNIRHSLASKRTVTITPAVRYRKHFD